MLKSQVWSEIYPEIYILVTFLLKHKDHVVNLKQHTRPTTITAYSFASETAQFELYLQFRRSSISNSIPVAGHTDLVEHFTAGSLILAAKY